MAAFRVAYKALIISSIAAAIYLGAAQAQGSDTAAAIAEVKAVQANLEKTHGKQQDLYWDQSINIHGSGWIYTKKDGWGPGKDYAAESAKFRPAVIKSEKSEYQIIAPNKDTVIESWLSAVYYSVPEPEALAKAMGTFSYDSKAISAANRARMDAALPAGMGPSDNPYRNRSTVIWSRIDGKWKITASVSSRVGQRVVPGRLGN